MQQTVLPPNARTALKTQALAKKQQLLDISRGNIIFTNNLVRAVTIKAADELDPTSAKAVEKMLAQPSSAPA